MEHGALVILVLSVFVLVDCDMVLVGISHSKIMPSEIAPQLVWPSSVQVLGSEVCSVGRRVVVFIRAHDKPTFFLGCSSRGFCDG
jgi:hypothetical protein